MSKIENFLMKCVAEEQSRFKHTRPHWDKEGGVVVATNGHVLCVVPETSLDYRTVIANFPNWRLVTDCVQPIETITFSIADYDFAAENREPFIWKSVDCEVCGGSLCVGCPTCGHEEACNNCDGDGKEWERDKTNIQLQDVLLDYDHFRLIEELATDFGNGKAVWRQGERTAQQEFVAGDVRLIVMPLDVHATPHYSILLSQR